MPKRLWSIALATALLTVACGGTPAPPSTSSSSGTQKNVGQVEFVSSQGTPANEGQKMNNQVLTSFNGHGHFIIGPTESQDVKNITADQKAVMRTIDVMALQQGDLTTL